MGIARAAARRQRLRLRVHRGGRDDPLRARRDQERRRRRRSSPSSRPGDGAGRLRLARRLLPRALDLRLVNRRVRGEPDQGRRLRLARPDRGPSSWPRLDQRLGGGPAAPARPRRGPGLALRPAGRRGRGGGGRARPPGSLGRRSGTQEQRLLNEKEVLGFYLSGHPLGAYRDRAQRLGAWASGELAARPTDGARSCSAGWSAALTRDQHQERQPHGVRHLEDVEGTDRGHVFPELYRQLRGAPARAARRSWSAGQVEGSDKGREAARRRDPPLPARDGATRADRRAAAAHVPRGRIRAGTGRPIRARGPPGDLRGAPRAACRWSCRLRVRRIRRSCVRVQDPARRARRRPSSQAWRGSSGRAAYRRGLTEHCGGRDVDLEKALEFERPLLELEAASRSSAPRAARRSTGDRAARGAARTAPAARSSGA